MLPRGHERDGLGLPFHRQRNNGWRALVFTEKIVPVREDFGVDQYDPSRNVAHFGKLGSRAFAHIHDGHMFRSGKRGRPRHRYGMDRKSSSGI
jgi:hypothetical protein